MGKRRHGAGGGGRGGGRGGGGGGGGEDGDCGGGGFGDQYGDGWSGGHRDEHSHSHGRGGGKQSGGGDAGGGKNGAVPQLSYKRNLPKFLQPFASQMASPGGDEEAPAVEDYNAGAVRRVGAVGDEEDLLAAVRGGLGSRAAAPGGAQRAAQESFAGVCCAEVDAEAESALRAERATAEKGKGNRAFSEGRHADAVRHFTVCCQLDSCNQVFFSNRSAAHAALGEWPQAQRDALKTTQLAPDWPKGWARLGAAAMGLLAFTEAAEAYGRAAQLEPGNEAYARSCAAAQAAEAQAMARNSFRFAPKAAKKVRREGAGAAVRNTVLLSFAADDGEAETDT